VHKDYLSSFAGFSTMAEFMGWRAEKAVGQELARLIRPEWMHATYRIGLPTLIDLRFRVTVMQKEARERNVEVTITQHEPPTATTFLAMLRHAPLVG
jgi:hypothetical protein